VRKMVLNLKSKTCTERRRSIEDPKWLGLSVLAFLLVVVGGPVAEAQQQSKIPKIGWLGVRPSGPGDGYGLLRRELRALGYIDGENIAFEYRGAENKIDRLPALADELVRAKVDVLLAAATTEAVAAKRATRAIPIVFFSAADPVALGLVESLARPGGNITGFTDSSSVLAGKRLELLKEIIPNLSRVRCCGIPQIRLLCCNGRRANRPHKNWLCNFTLQR
jgi:putative ABC transport system substrate-binding protein